MPYPATGRQSNYRNIHVAEHCDTDTQELKRVLLVSIGGSKWEVRDASSWSNFFHFPTILVYLRLGNPATDLCTKPRVRQSESLMLDS